MVTRCLDQKKSLLARMLGEEIYSLARLKKEYTRSLAWRKNALVRRRSVLGAWRRSVLACSLREKVYSLARSEKKNTHSKEVYSLARRRAYSLARSKKECTQACLLGERVYSLARLEKRYTRSLARLFVSLAKKFAAYIGAQRVNQIRSEISEFLANIAAQGSTEGARKSMNF